MMMMRSERRWMKNKVREEGEGTNCTRNRKSRASMLLSASFSSLRSHQKWLSLQPAGRGLLDEGYIVTESTNNNKTDAFLKWGCSSDGRALA